jgi:acetyl-CoA acetyltransferase
LIGSGVVDMAMACDVGLMSRVPIGSNSSKKLGLDVPIPKTYFGQYEMTSQFEGADRIADKWRITREDTDAFVFLSQQRAAQAWAEGRFDGLYINIEAPVLGDGGAATGELRMVKGVGCRPSQDNPNGGAIALGHPLGGTGAFLLTKALYELERTQSRYGLVSMCCGGGLGTGTMIERL